MENYTHTQEGSLSVYGQSLLIVLPDFQNVQKDKAKYLITKTGNSLTQTETKIFLNSSHHSSLIHLFN